MSHTNVTLGTTHTSHHGAEFGQYTFVLDRDKERHIVPDPLFLSFRL